MVWREPRNHFDDCYFCAINLKGINRKNKKHLQYPSLPSANRPVPHSQSIPVPVFKSLPDLTDCDGVPISDVDEDDKNDEEYVNEDLSSEPKLFDQGELNDLVRDLNLTKKSAELLASRLGEKNLLQKGTKVSYYRKKR